MKIGDYDVNPYAAIGGGLLGAGLGLGAYALDSNKTKKKLATYAAIGACLGLGTGALASLAPHMTDEEKAKAKDIANASDVNLNPINMGFRATPTITGFIGGAGATRMGRELGAYKGALAGSKKAVKQLIKAYMKQNGVTKGEAIKQLRAARVADLVRGDNWLASALGLGRGGSWKMVGRGAADLGGGLAGAVGLNLANNFIDWI